MFALKGYFLIIILLGVRTEFLWQLSASENIPSKYSILMILIITRRPISETLGHRYESFSIGTMYSAL